MSDATRIKLEPGAAPVVGTLELVEDWNGNFGPATTLTIATDDGLVEIVDKPDKVDQQLNRLGHDRATAIGQAFAFSKTPMKTDPSKGFFNIDLPKGIAAARKPVTDRAAARPAVLDDEPGPTGKAHGGVHAQVAAESKIAAAGADYLQATEFVLEKVTPLWSDAGIKATPEAVNAAAATVVIGAQRR